MPLQPSLGMGWLQGHSSAEATPAPAASQPHGKKHTWLTGGNFTLQKRERGVVQCSLLAAGAAGSLGSPGGDPFQLLPGSHCPGRIGVREPPAPAAPPGAHPKGGM